MKLSHSDTILPEFTCYIDGCISIHRTVDAFRKHISRAHNSHWKALSIHNFEIAESQSSNVDETLQDFDMDTSYTIGDDHCPSTSNVKQELGQNNTFSKLKTTEIHMLPKSTATAIFDNVKELMNFYQFGFQNLVSSRLSAMGIDYESDDLLSEVLRPESHFEDVTAMTASDHLLKKYCSTNLNLVEPIPLYVDRACHCK